MSSNGGEGNIPSSRTSIIARFCGAEGASRFEEACERRISERAFEDKRGRVPIVMVDILRIWCCRCRCRCCSCFLCVRLLLHGRVVSSG